MRAIFLALILSSLSHVAHSYTGSQYAGKETVLKPRTFRRYVLPQLRTMIREYYILLSMFHPLEDKLIDIKETVEKIFLSWEELKSECFNIKHSNNPDQQKAKNKICQQQYTAMYGHSKRMDKHLIKLQDSVLISKKTKGNREESVGNLIYLTVTMSEVMNLNYYILNAIEQSRSMMFNIHARRNIKKRLDSTIHSARLLTDELLTSQFGKREKDIFDFAWVSFFKRLNNNVVYPRDKEHLLRHLEELNIAWNTVSIKLTKGHTAHSRAVKLAVKVLHTRWNSILKVILQT